MATTTTTGKPSDNDPDNRASATAAVEAASANPGEKRSVGTRKAPARDLAPAAESGDPAVHQLIAEMDILRQNGDDDAVKAKQGELAELGYK